MYSHFFSHALTFPSLSKWWHLITFIVFILNYCAVISRQYSFLYSWILIAFSLLLTIFFPMVKTFNLPFFFILAFFIFFFKFFLFRVVWCTFFSSLLPCIHKIRVAISFYHSCHTQSLTYQSVMVFPLSCERILQPCLLSWDTHVSSLLLLHRGRDQFEQTEIGKEKTQNVNSHLYI